MRKSITESLVINVETLEWECCRCQQSLGTASENYKMGCLIAQRSPDEIWQPLVDGELNFTYNAGWSRIVEFYCPGCGALIEVEMLPPGHPLTHDIELDIDALSHAAPSEPSPTDSDQ